MQTIMCRVEDEIKERLERLASETHHTKSSIVREALLKGLDDMEDVYLADQVIKRIRSGEEETSTLAEVETRLGLTPYKVGSRPPSTLSAKATRQLQRAHVSPKLMSIMEKAYSAQVTRVTGVGMQLTKLSREARRQLATSVAPPEALALAAKAADIAKRSAEQNQAADVNEWQTKGIIEAVKEADSPNAEWTDHAVVKAKWGASTTPAASAKKALDKTKVLTKAVVNTAIYLNIPKNKLAHILGVSRATVTRLYADAYRLSPDKKEWDFAVLLVRLFRSLDSIVGGSANDARKWLNSENTALAGNKPADLIDTPEGIVLVVTYLDTCWNQRT